MNPEIVVAGSLNRDLVLRVERFPAPGETVMARSLEQFCGGKGANQAYAAALLGGRVAMIGEVGMDHAGEAQIANLSKAGVDTRFVLRNAAAPTGTAVIAVDPAGENRIIAAPGANQSFTSDKLAGAETVLSSCRILLVQLEVPRETVFRAIQIARSSGAAIILDPAPAPDSPLPDDLLRSVDYLTPNISELAVLTSSRLDNGSSIDDLEAAARKLCSRGARNVLAKLGERGVMLVSDRATEHIAAISVKVADTTAAGDCFNAAFAVALLGGKSLRESARFACAAAACSVTRPGAQPSMPRLEEAEQLLATGQTRARI